MNDYDEAEIDLETQIEEDNDDEDNDDDGNQVGYINPWRQPINHITWGLILTTFTLNTYLLQYILPTIGIALMYLGFRSLRKCNKDFTTVWIIAVFKFIWHVVDLVIYASPYNMVYTSNIIIRLAFIVIQIVLLIVFRKAIKDVFIKINKIPNRDPLLSVIIWNILLAICAIIPLGDIWVVLLLLLLIYLFILKSLFGLSHALCGATHVFLKATTKVSNRMVILYYLIACLILVSGSCVISNHIILNDVIRPVGSGSETRNKLVNLGFPEDILIDISDDDISMLSEATYVYSHNEMLHFNPVIVTTKIGDGNYSTNSKPGNCNLKATTIYIECPNTLLYVIEFFDWMDSKAYWQDGFTIQSLGEIDLLNGALLYKKNETEWIAPIPRLKCDAMTSNDFSGVNRSRMISGAVSYPYGAKRQRGYIFYRSQYPEGQLVAVNCLNYLHYAHPIQFPYSDTELRLFTGSTGNNMKQHYTNFEMQEYRDNYD